MTPAIAFDVPRSLLEDLFRSEQAGRPPTLPKRKGEAARAWLRYVLTDLDAFDRHIAVLQEFYQSPFPYPLRDREGCPAGLPLPDPARTRFRHTERLAADRVLAVADRGVEALRDDELACLLLNPFALHDLFDTLGELQPPAWLGVFGATARESVRHSHPEPRRDPKRQRRLVLVAAGIVLLVFCGGAAGAMFGVWLLSVLQGVEIEKHPEPGLALHFDPDERPKTWDEIWADNYRAADEPKANLDRLYKESNAKVRTQIDELRKEKVPSYKILAELMKSYGPRGREEGEEAKP